jgi:hypothetical protein
MANLKLSSEVLDELITAFNGFGDLLSQACTDIRTGDGAVTGDDPLSGSVHGFASSWNYGLGQLGQHAADCSKELKKINTTFQQLETQLTDELKGSKS